MDTQLYYPLLQRTRLSVFTFGLYITDELDPASDQCPELIKRFCEDDDLQHLQIGSGNFGFIWKLRKLYREEGKPMPRLPRLRFAFRNWLENVIWPWFVTRRDFEDAREHGRQLREADKANHLELVDQHATALHRIATLERKLDQMGAIAHQMADVMGGIYSRYPLDGGKDKDAMAYVLGKFSHLKQSAEEDADYPPGA